MNAEKEFWDWFAGHEVELFNLDPEQEEQRERVFDELAAQLNKVHRELSFEFGPIEARREFVISASGIREAFPSVTSLVTAAPALPRWQITAFRPRRNPVHVVEYRGKRVDPKKVQFALLSNGKKAGIHIFIPGFKENERDMNVIGYLLLDETLGEYDVALRLGLIAMHSPDTQTKGKRYALPELPRLFDELVESLQGGANLKS
jgi:hypothetical protein